MDRNREARKSTMAASANGLSRRRQRSNSLRDSPEEDAPMELQETARLRDRGVKKDRDRDRSSRSKRRRGDRLNGGEESSEESVNDDEEDDYDDERGGGAGGGGVVRMFPPPNPTSLVPSSLSNHHYVNRKSYPPAAAAKVLRPAAPGWKPADEVIGFTVPRKARSASGKRSQECSISGSGVVADQINRQTSTSPVRLTPSPSPVSPPSSSNASVRKKMKPNGSKPRPPKSSSKPSSSSPEELEIEIAEVLYGMSSSKKEITGNHSANLDLREINNKSRVSSPISNPTSQLPQNSSSSAAPVSAVAPKRKRPRQVSDNLGNSSVRHIPISSTTVTKVEVDLAPKKEISSSNMGSVAENGSVPRDFASSQVGPPPSEPPPPDSGRSESLWETRDVGQAEDEAVTSPKKESPMVRTDNDRELATVTKADPTIPAIESQREEKFEIDLMAPPPQTRSSPEREGEINFAAAVDKPLTTDKEDESAVKSGKEEAINVEPEPIKVKVTQEEAESEKKPVVNKERNIDLQLDLEKQEREISASSNKLNPDVQKPQQQQQQPKAIKDEPQPTEKIAQSGSLPLPMSVASWPGGLPPMGYMAPLQGVVSMEGNTVSPTPIPPLFSHPRPKRCATHFYIARNIHFLQQFMKMNALWPPSAGPAASMFGGKTCNLNVLPSAELHGNNAGRNVNSVQEKGQGLAIFSGHSGKDKGAQATNIPDAQRKQQQIMLQQALPPGAPSNILHGPAFIFPLNHQQAAAAAAAASIRPGSVKPPTSGNVAATGASTSASVSGSTTAPPAGTAVTFNYPNMPASETQYLAILQNNAYPFPIPSVGAPPTYRGTHAQAMPFFNGSFYSPQMMHPSQLQQQQQQPPTQQQNTSSSSSSSQKHLHQQQQQQQQQQHQRQQGSSGSNLHSFPAQKKANQHMPNAEVGGEDSPSTADSRGSRASMGVYSQNFAAVPMPIHPQNYALMTHPPPSTLGGASGGSGNQGEKKQQQGLKAGLESMSPQTFAMSFGSMNGLDMSVAQNHVVLQSVEATRQSFQMMAAATDAAQVGQQKKNFRVSEEGKNAAAACDSSNNIDEEKKSSALKPVGQQSIVFSRTDLPESVSSPPLRAQRPAIPNTMGAMQYHQQQMMQLHKHQQQQQQLVAAAAAAARNKTPPMSNGSVYNDHLASSAKYPNGISNFPQNLVQNSSGNPSQSPQWKNPMKTTSQVPSTTSSLKNLPQQQTRTQHNQTQNLSFGGAQKPATAPPQGQQAATSHQAPSPPMAVGSPTTSSISKGASGSPRTTTTSASAGTKSAQPSTLSSQPSKNSASVGSRNVSSVLGNAHVASFSNTSAKSQMQQQQQQQQQMFLPHAYLQAQPSNQPFFLQRRRLEQQPQGSSTASSSTGMMSLCSPVQGSNASTSDAKAVAASAASAAASNLKAGGLSSQGIHHSAVPPGFSYVHAVPSPGQLKPAEQKQPTGNRDSLTKK